MDQNMSSQQKLWHCLITKTETTSVVVNFYNELGLDLIRMDNRDKHFYVSTVAPLIILEENENQEKSLFMWPKQICPQFKKTFPQIQQVLGFENLENLEVPNTCNFNSIIRCLDLNQATSKLTSYEWVKEKHGKGPEHFHGSVGVHEVEIYPLKKKQKNTKMSLEFYFDNVSKDPIIPELKAKAFVPLEDPEGRTFIVGTKKD